MLYKTRARNARPYGYGGIMRSSFFRNIVGARIARPLLEFVQNFGFAHLLTLSILGCEFLQLPAAQVYTPENALYPPSTGSTMPVTKLAARSSTRKSIAPISSLSSP